MNKKLLYEGKAKKVYSIDGVDNQYFVEFKNSLTAFNALKKGEFAGKGAINRQIASLLFRELEKNQIATHWIQDVEPDGMIVRPVDIIPLEVVIRNVLAGSTAKKFGRSEGEVLPRPLVEFYYKNDALEDPLMTEEQADILGVCDLKTQLELRKIALKVNELLQKIFLSAHLRLVDFKIEFGFSKSDKKILLADEISPDCCRLWDTQTNEKMDKDRFRRDLGKIDEKYAEVLERLQKSLKKENV